jgi:hypothetical protein
MSGRVLITELEMLTMTATDQDRRPTIAEQIEWLEKFNANDGIHIYFDAILASLRSVEALQRDAAIGAFVRDIVTRLGPIASQAGKSGNVTAYFKERDNMKDVQELHALLAGRFDLIAAMGAS